MAPAKKAAARTSTGRKATKKSAQTPKSMPREGRDPKGGLTAKGREFFNKTEGSHLRPGVTGPADTPEKMVRKGSFLRRHFANPRGPMKNDKGEPTRLALSAHAWGEPVPQTTADARKLAAEGHELLEEYHQIRDAAVKGTRKSGAKSAKKSTAKKGLAKAASGKQAARKSAGKKVAAKKVAAKKVAGKKVALKKGASRRS